MTLDPLVNAIAVDLPGSFEHLVESYQNRIFAFALRLTGSPSDAEEIVQDAFLRAYRALRAYPTERTLALALRPWLYQITLNVARNRYRRQRPIETSLDTDDGLPATEPRASVTTHPEDRLLASERTATLERCLLDLPLRFRAAVILRHVEGLPYADVAATLNIPVGTAKANVHRGVRILRTALTAVGEQPTSRREMDGISEVPSMAGTSPVITRVARRRP